MKKLALLSLLVAATTISAQAQGRVTFASGSPASNSKFQLEDGTLLDAASGYVASLMWGTATGVYDTTETWNVPFASNAAQAGYFFGGVQQLTGWTSGEIFGVVQVWNPTDGTTYAEAASAGGPVVETPEFAVTPTLSPVPAPNIPLGGPNTFIVTTTIVPEPTTFALAGLGGLALLVFRRRA